MTDREKRAINLFKNYQYKLVYEISDKDKEAAKTLLNLIQKQDTEINKLNNVIDRMAEKINQAYFDEYNMWLWFEKEICPKNEDGKFDFKDLGTRKKRIKEYFMNKTDIGKEGIK